MTPPAAAPRGHTSGPWEASVTGTVVSARMKHIDARGEVMHYDGHIARLEPGPERVPNSRLIAAAPSLLEATERLMDWLSHSSAADAVPPSIAEAARAAIKLATGAP